MVWWVLIEEIALRAEEVACCVRGYYVYKDIYVWAATIRKVLVSSREPTNIGKFFVVKLYSCERFSYVFCV